MSGLAHLRRYGSRSCTITPAPLSRSTRSFHAWRPLFAPADMNVEALTITKTNSPKPMPDTKDLVFGKTFSDHMLLVPWTEATGWQAPQIVPYGPLALEPASTIFHYAPSVFEGMKAYIDPQGSIRLFRPDMNMKRMKMSVKRVALPDFDGEAAVELIKKLLVLDKKFIPNQPGYSLYLRPTMIGTTPSLGVSASTDALFFVIASPVGPYYKTGFKPVGLLCSENYSRAAPGGTGGYKLGANYAPGVLPQMEAAEQGYGQILWLYGPDDELTEVGTMNLFVVLKDATGATELVTPPLDDMILPGVTRDSVLSIARQHANTPSKIPGLPSNLKISERKITMGELVQAREQGRLLEVFGSGTAAIVSPVNRIGYKGKDMTVPVGPDGLGPITKAILDEIVGRQTGKIPSDWSVKVD